MFKYFFHNSKRYFCQPSIFSPYLFQPSRHSVLVQKYSQGLNQHSFCILYDEYLQSSINTEKHLARASFSSNYVSRISLHDTSVCNSKKSDVGENDSSSKKMVKILNVAEKNDASKNISNILSRGGSVRRDGFSPYNKIYEFPYTLQGQPVQMVFTSVSGHLLNHEFVGNYKRWYGCSPIELFDAPVSKGVKEESMEKIKRTLEREVRGASKLIIWTDCDREGENIGYEIITVCQAIKPNIPIFRAKFSEITGQSITRAINALSQPDLRQSQAVDVRSELDLRIGAAFTRFQTLRLQKVFPASLADTLISYGSCQFPTLGFVVQRYKQIQDFIPENFWKLKATHVHDEGSTDFSWLRVRLFDETSCRVLLETCEDDPVATVASVNSRPKSKWRPLPLDTVEFEKMASRKLRISAKDAMKIAEKLYTSGLISYPRTETNIFPKELNLLPLVEVQMQDNRWGEFAARVMERGLRPRQGKKTDEAHPPIHPTKAAPQLEGDEKKVYELITRTFLACVSDDAKGHETVVEIRVAGEHFRASGLIILERNYLEVYPYDKWTDKPMPIYEVGYQFTPEIEMVGGQTSPPSLLTEADLIALMEKHGIGTDATHAEHIETIKSRSYVGLQDQKFVPGTLGMGLVNGYDDMGFQMSQPHLRAGLEEDLKAICEGRKDPAVVLQEQIQKYKEVFEEAIRQADKLDTALSTLLEEVPAEAPREATLPSFAHVSTCGQCSNKVVVKQKRNGVGYYLSCQGFPDCKVCVWFPDNVVSVEVTPEKCQRCSGSPSIIKLRLKPRSYAPILPDVVTTCIQGCDTFILDTLGIRPLPGPGTTGNARLAPANRATIGRGNGTAPIGRGNGTAPRGNAGRTRGNGRGPGNAPAPSQGAPHTPDDWGDDDFGGDNLWGGGGRGGGRNNSNARSGFAGAPRGGLGGPSNRGSSSQGSSTGFSSQWALPSSSTSHDAGSDPNQIVCNCGDNAVLLTVRKEGPNTGRQFYKCPKPMGSGCNFFLWADDGAAPGTGGGGGPPPRGGGPPPRGRGRGGGMFPPSAGTSFGSGGSGYNSSFSASFNDDADSEIPMCQCGTACIKRTVQKEGPNKGREFFVCTKDMSSRCDHFSWADQPSNAGATFRGGTRGRATTRGRGGGRGQKRGASASGGAPKKRKCGLCGEEGHNRKNCPSNA